MSCFAFCCGNTGDDGEDVESDAYTDDENASLNNEIATRYNPKYLEQWFGKGRNNSTIAFPLPEHLQSPSQSTITTIDDLPDDCLEPIFDDLSLRDLLAVGQVCRRWNESHRVVLASKRRLIIQSESIRDDDDDYFHDEDDQDDDDHDDDLGKNRKNYSIVADRRIRSGHFRSFVAFDNSITQIDQNDVFDRFTEPPFCVAGRYRGLFRLRLEYLSQNRKFLPKFLRKLPCIEKLHIRLMDEPKFESGMIANRSAEYCWKTIEQILRYYRRQLIVIRLEWRVLRESRAKPFIERLGALNRVRSLRHLRIDCERCECLRPIVDNSKNVENNLKFLIGKKLQTFYLNIGEAVQDWLPDMLMRRMATIEAKWRLRRFGLCGDAGYRQYQRIDAELCRHVTDLDIRRHRIDGKKKSRNDHNHQNNHQDIYARADQHRELDHLVANFVSLTNLAYDLDRQISFGRFVITIARLDSLQRLDLRVDVERLRDIGAIFDAPLRPIESLREITLRTSIVTHRQLYFVPHCFQHLFPRVECVRLSIEYDDEDRNHDHDDKKKYFENDDDEDDDDHDHKSGRKTATNCVDCWLANKNRHTNDNDNDNNNNNVRRDRENNCLACMLDACARECCGKIADHWVACYVVESLREIHVEIRYKMATTIITTRMMKNRKNLMTKQKDVRFRTDDFEEEEEEEEVEKRNTLNRKRQQLLPVTPQSYHVSDGREVFPDFRRYHDTRFSYLDRPSCDTPECHHRVMIAAEFRNQDIYNIPTTTTTTKNNNNNSKTLTAELGAKKACFASIRGRKRR